MDSTSTESPEGPRDLSLKTLKKTKPIPPPLDLTSHNEGNDPLKEFACIATSPRSPLVQKNLPFRKRAHSWSVHDTNSSPNSQNATPNPLPPPTPTFALPTPSPYSPRPALAPKTTFSFNGLTPPPWSPAGHSPGPWTTVLLSPAPSQPSSSLGGSREELNGNSTALTEPSTQNGGILTGNFEQRPPVLQPVWGCILAGSRVKLASDEHSPWFNVEDVIRFDWFPTVTYGLEVRHIAYLSSNRAMAAKVQITLQPISSTSCPIIAECSIGHPFLVQNKGWCAVRVESALESYGLTCVPLDIGDLCVVPHMPLQVATPDLCDSLKSFNFAPVEDVLPTGKLRSDLFVSPPSSPTKKAKDNRPKRPMNAFMLFAKSHRLELIQKHPGKDNRAISVILGDTWKRLPAVERERYSDQARAMAAEKKRLYPDCWKRKRSQSTS